jgi:Flp pilus assembly protein TadD
MDTLDRVSIWIIVILIISSFVLTGGHRGEARPEVKAKHRADAAGYSVVNVELNKKVKLIKNLVESNNLDKAEMMLKELSQQHPFEGGPHMVMGDILMRKQMLLEAMPEYKEAIDLNPDYLDKKTPLFQGKKLKIAAREALAEVDRKIEESPDDNAIKKSRKLIYYLKRRIAGSCG